MAESLRPSSEVVRAAWNVAVRGLEPHEARPPVRFGSSASRVRHVRKHVLAAADERWRDLLDRDQVAAAKRADIDQERSPPGSVKIVAKDYEGVLAEVLVCACKEEKDHVHLGKLDLVSAVDERTPRFAAAQQKVFAWDRPRRIVVLADAPAVSGTGFGPYRIRTGYRGPLGGRDTMFARLCEGRARELARTRGYMMIAVHDRSPVDAGPASRSEGGDVGRGPDERRTR